MYISNIKTAFETILLVYSCLYII